MSEIPIAVREYLETDDALHRAQLLRQHPELEEELHGPKTRAALLIWLQDNDAWSQPAIPLTLNCLEFLRTKASETEATMIRPFLLHKDRRVRLAAYEFLRALYYPDKNREAMNQLYLNMLMDSEDTIRAQAVRYLKQAGAEVKLKAFLQRWYKVALDRGWDKSESYELLGQLLNE